MNTRFTVALVLPLMILGCKSEEPSDSGQEASNSVQEPSGSVQLVRLECSHQGFFYMSAERREWDLALDADGRAKLTIRRNLRDIMDRLAELDADGLLGSGANVDSMMDLKDTERTFLVDEGRIAAIETAISKYRFFALPAEIGDNVIDGSRRVLSIWTTNGQKTVTITDFAAHISFEDYSVSVESFKEDTIREDARCALKLWKVVRDCFSDEEAVDARADDKELLQLMNSPGRLTDDQIEELNSLLEERGHSHEAEKPSGVRLEAPGKEKGRRRQLAPEGGDSE